MSRSHQIEEAGGPAEETGLLRVHHAVAACVVAALIALSVHAGRAAPPPFARTPVVQEGERVPRALFLRWIREFPAFERLFLDGDADTLAAFTAHLRSRASVAEVKAVRFVWRGEPARRVIAVDLEIRDPVLPIVFDDGRQAWIDAEGHFLDPELVGPDHAPPVYGHRRGPAELAEVLSVWSFLWRELEEVGVVAIRCDRELGRGRGRGLVFETAAGTRLVWGGAGAARYGLSPEQKARNLVHAIRCQGDLARVAVIDVRFPRPRVTIPR